MDAYTNENLMKKAENVVFRIVDSKLKEAPSFKPEDFLPAYDVVCYWSIQTANTWKGAFMTTVDELVYEVEYNPVTKMSAVEVFKKVDTYVFPD